MNDRLFHDRSGSLRWIISLVIIIMAVAAIDLSSPERINLSILYAVPLLACVWGLRKRRALWITAGTVVLLTFIDLLIKFVFKTEIDKGVPQKALWINRALVAGSVLLIAFILHLVIGAWERIAADNIQIQQHNDALEATNHRLAAREEEIAAQNEELQSQAEEYERQSEELRVVNEELEHRETLLRQLLELSRSLTADLTRPQVMIANCQAVKRFFGGAAEAAAICERRGDRLLLRCQDGFGPDGPETEVLPFDRTFAGLVIERGQTAFLDDLQKGPDLSLPRPKTGPPFRSILAAPLWVRGKTIGTLEVYSPQPRLWTDQQVSLIESLAAQTSISLESSLLFEELDHHRRELERRRKEAEEASLRKTRFMAAISHDIRTPTNAINLLAELIKRSHGNPNMTFEIPQLAADLQASALSLVELVSDVLDLARFDSDMIDLQDVEFDLGLMVEEECRPMQATAGQKGLRLQAVPPARPIWLKADRVKLGRLIANLIGNAIKFTHAGGVRVETRLTGQGEAIIRVIDTGVGIDPEHLSHIFDEFVQLHNPERDRNKGIGLGLAICQRLAEAMDGKIDVQSRTGGGSTFTVILPSNRVIHRPSTPQSPPVAAERLSADGNRRLAGLRVLLVEDHHVTRRATRELLASEGADVIEAPDGRTAMQLLPHCGAHVMLLDMMLPDLDGSEILKAAASRRPPQLRDILVLSGDVTEQRQHQVKQWGADALIAKPIDLPTLLQTLQSIR